MWHLEHFECLRGIEMKKYFLFFGALGILCCLSLGNAFAVTFRVTRVYDGDTVMAEGQGVTIYVMLIGIDAPEISEIKGVPSQPYGKSARDYLSRLILGKDVSIKGYGKAPFPDNNIVGVIFLNGKNVNLEMVKHGLAEVCEEGLPEGFDITPFVQAEKMARKNKLGMWSLGEKYISPSKWRQMHRRKSGSCTE